MNPTKCKSSKTDSLLVLGTPISKSGEPPKTVADALLQRAETYEMVMKWNGEVYNSKLYTILRQVVLARLNYAPSVDYVPISDRDGVSVVDWDAEVVRQNKAKNTKIDEAIARMVKHVLPLGNVDMDEQQLMQALAAPFDQGGLEFMLPGLTYDHQIEFTNEKWTDLR